MPPSAEEKEAQRQYYTSTRTELESALACAVSNAIGGRVQEPVKWVANFLLQRLEQQRGGMDAADGAPSRAAGADNLAQATT